MFLVCYYIFFFFKQKTAYEMRISDWSSDVCSSDLVQDVGRWSQRAAVPRRPLGRAEGLVGGVRLGRRRQIDDELRQGQLALRAADALEGLPGGNRLGQRRRVGEADVLHRNAHPAAGDVVRVLAAGQHAREPVERGIAVGPAPRLVQGADESGRAHVSTPVTNAH